MPGENLATMLSHWSPYFVALRKKYIETTVFGEVFKISVNKRVFKEIMA